MKFSAAAFFLLLAAGLPSQAQEKYGAKGIFPVYEASGQWLIFDKAPRRQSSSHLSPGNRFLVIGSKGAELFTVMRTSSTYGGACKGKTPLKLNAALLRGRRQTVGSPIIGIHVPERFTLNGSKAEYQTLSNQVAEDTYLTLDAPLKQAVVENIQSGSFRFKLEDNPTPEFLQNPKLEKIQLKIDFGSRVELNGLANPFVLVEGTQVYSTYRRCLRLAEGNKLVGGCVEMPAALMAETSLLQFVSYDPSGKGNPFLLAYTPQQPLWGHERWGFMLKKSGPQLFLMDSLDLRCRESF